jgi:hypothetical protein
VLPPEGSITAAVRPAPGAVVAAFQHVPAASLRDLDGTLECDVLVAGATTTPARPCSSRRRDRRPAARRGRPSTARHRDVRRGELTVNLRHKGESRLRLEGSASAGDDPS